MEISVTDTGIGIAREPARIFEEFRQLGSDYEHEGEVTGLGLTLAKKLLRYGKDLGNKRGGKASRFTFTLPVTAAT